jgi:hypothetical protein
MLIERVNLASKETLTTPEKSKRALSVGFVSHREPAIPIEFFFYIWETSVSAACAVLYQFSTSRFPLKPYTCF